MRRVALALLAILPLAACTAATPTSCRIGEREVAWAAPGITELDAIVSTCPPALECGAARTVTVVGEFGPSLDGTLACLDAGGRWDGPAIGVVGTSELRVWFRGAYTREAPSGPWTCTNVVTGERLEFEIDPAAFAKNLWGIELASLGPAQVGGGGVHLGPLPANVCPPRDWETLARDGFVVPGLEHVGDLAARGVVSHVRHVPGG